MKIILSLLSLVVIGAGSYYLLTQNKSPIPSFNSPAPQAPEASPSIQPSTTASKIFNNESIGVTFNYPVDWVIQDSIISEKPFVPGEQDRTQVYNIIEVQKQPTPLYSGYKNSEWFNKINNSTSPLIDQREKINKLESGTVATGEPYVIFAIEPSSTAQSENFKQIKAYILKNEILYQLTLNQFDQKGSESLYMIVPSISVK